MLLRTPRPSAIARRLPSKPKKEGLLRDLKQAQVAKVEAEKKVGDFIVKVQKEVQVFKRLKYKQGYKDQPQGKALRYPLQLSGFRGDQGASRSLASDAPLPIVASVVTIKAPQDRPARAATAVSLTDPGPRSCQNVSPRQCECLIVFVMNLLP